MTPKPPLTFLHVNAQDLIDNALKGFYKNHPILEDKIRGVIICHLHLLSPPSHWSSSFTIEQCHQEYQTRIPTFLAECEKNILLLEDTSSEFIPKETFDIDSTCPSSSSVTEPSSEPPSPPKLPPRQFIFPKEATPDIVMEAIESYLTTTNYSKLFPHPIDKGPSQLLNETIQELCEAGLTLEDCSLSKEVIQQLGEDFEKNLIKTAGAVLLQLHFCATPKGKLEVIALCHEKLVSLLQSGQLQVNHITVGSDVVVPLLIYLVVKTNPPQLYDHMAYIQRYARQSYLSKGVFAFCNANLASVIGYLQSIDTKFFVERHELQPVSSEGKTPTISYTPMDYITDNAITVGGKKVLLGAFSVLNTIVTTPAITGGSMIKGLLKWEDKKDIALVDLKLPIVQKFTNRKWQDLTMQEIPELLQAYQQLAIEYQRLHLEHVERKLRP